MKINLLTGAPDFDSPVLKTLEVFTVAEGAFEYRFGVDPEDKRNTLWLFEVHQAHWLYATTGVLADAAL